MAIPKHSMYEICRSVGVVWGVNVGKYAVHGVFGIDSFMHEAVESVEGLSVAPSMQRVRCTW